MEFFATAVLAIVLCVLLYRYVISGPRQSELPGPRAYPFVGNALQINPKTFHEQFSAFARQYGNVYGLNVFGSPYVLLNTVEVVNTAFCSEGYKDILNDRPMSFLGVHVFKEKDILFRKADKEHSDLRKLLVKAFHVYGEGIVTFENVMNDEIHRVMDQIVHSDGHVIEPVDLFQRSMSNFITILLTGDQVGDTVFKDIIGSLALQEYFSNPVNDGLLRTVPSLCRSPLYRRSFQNLLSHNQRILDKLFYEVKETRNPGTIRGLVDWYLDEQERQVGEGGELLLTDEVIQVNVLDIAFAGMTTTSAVLTNTLHCLVNNPGYQTKIQRELDRVIGNNREPSVGDRHDCDFLMAVIFESQRFIPPVPITVPHLCAEDVELESKHVKANSLLFINIWHIHHDESIWGDPYTFRPERFLDDNGKLLANTHVNMKSLMTFGTGRRKCPGMSLANARIFLYLSHFLQRWTFLPVPGQCGPSDPRTDSYECKFVVRAKPFRCFAQIR